MFGVVRRGGGPKTLILIKEQLDAMAEVLPMLRDVMCSCETFVGCRSCESVAFRLDLTHSRRTAFLYVDSQFTSLTLQGIEYLSRMFNIVQLQLRDYILALEIVLPYVTANLTSVAYVEPAPEASISLIFPTYTRN